MRLRVLAVHVNINVAVTGAGADVTKSAQTRARLAPASNVGTVQNALTSLIPHLNYITENVIIVALLILAIRAAGGAAALRNTIYKTAHGQQPLNLLIDPTIFQAVAYAVQRLALMRPLIALV